MDCGRRWPCASDHEESEQQTRCAMLYDLLLQRLGEFFVDINEGNVIFSLGDLFDPSQFRLRDVFLRTELINALNLPFDIKGGYIGDVRVEGFVGFVAGSPLTITVDNVCLVLGQKPVEWSTELALRYAKELIIAVIQSVAPTAPSSKKTKEQAPAQANDSFNISPAKWILNKLQATIAETTVRLERLHLRFESEHEGQIVAYGAYVPTVQLSTRETDDQILNRRQQLGVRYPHESADTASKRLYLGNVSLYCDLHASSYIGDSPQPRASPRTPRGSRASPPTATSRSLSTTERMKCLRDHCQQPFTPNTDRDLILISALWIKLDFVRTADSWWGLGAIDVVTEGIRIDGDVAQLSVLQRELARVHEFNARCHRLATRPCNVDREHHAPPHVSRSMASLFPVVTGAHLEVLHSEPQRLLSSDWLRGMWRYAARSVLMSRRTSATAKRLVRLGAVKTRPDHDSASRYINLYKRSLSDEAIKIVLFGKALLPLSPRATDTRKKQQATTSIPVYERLSRGEQWELSDLVQLLSVHGQRVFRHQAHQQIREEYVSYQSGEATPSVSSPRTGLTISIPDPLPREWRGSGASIAPKHSRSSPTHALHPLTPTTLVDGSTELPEDFVANHHAHHSTRARSESSPTKMDSRSSPSPTSIRGHAPLLHAASAPVDRSKKMAPSSPTTFFKPTSPMAKQRAFIEALLPPWMLHPSRVIPLINWHIGPITLRLHRRLPAEDEPPVLRVFSTTPKPSTAKIPPRATTADLEITVDGCTGCILLSRSPSVSFLIELRVGRMQAVLVAPSAGSSNTHPNSIATDYIRDTADGFIYLGLKYNFRHTTQVASLLPREGGSHDEPQWDVKSKLCVGPICICYDDLALQTAMQSSIHSGPVAADTPSIRLDSASYLTIVEDVLANWKAVVQRAQPTKQHVVHVPKSMIASSTQTSMDQQKRLATRERVAKLLDALMHHSSFVDVALSGMELELAMLTKHVVQRVVPLAATSKPAIVPVYESEQVHISLPATTAGLQNLPVMNECQVYAGGARVKFRTTSHGRAAVIDHVLHKLFPPTIST